MAEDDYCYLTTTGRRTGQRHEIEIWYSPTEDGRTLYLLAGARERSDWVRNLSANPRCTVRIGRRDAPMRRAQGRILHDGDPEDVVARDLVFAKYQGRSSGDLTDWRARSLPVALDLDLGD